MQRETEQRPQTRAAVEQQVSGIVGHANVWDHLLDQLVHHRCGQGGGEREVQYLATGVNSL